MPLPLFPACEVCFPASDKVRTATFFLAAEEYVARRCPAGSYLFSWVLPPTVVMGRNQVAHQEFDLDYCAREGIDVVRRKSGGGAVFADGSNIMWSLVCGGGEVEDIFRAYTNAVARALNALGAPVQATGRNDIVLKSGGKVCGNAFYRLGDRSIVHGTMLYDTNAQAMQRALRPDPDKLQAKGVQSVRRRIGLLKDHISGGTDCLRAALTRMLTDRVLTLTASEVAEIERLERHYRRPDFLMGHIRSTDVTLGRRIEGCGMLELHFTLRGSMVEDVELRGDFFELSDARAVFCQAFRGTPFTAASLQASAHRHALHRSVRGLSEQVLTALLAEA